MDGVLDSMFPVRVTVIAVVIRLEFNPLAAGVDVDGRSAEIAFGAVGFLSDDELELLELLELLLPPLPE
jgi:hypothetical protein